VILKALNLLNKGAVIVCETDNHTELPETLEGFQATKQKLWADQFNDL